MREIVAQPWNGPVYGTDQREEFQYHSKSNMQLKFNIKQFVCGSYQICYSLIPIPFQFWITKSPIPKDMFSLYDCYST